MAKRSVAKRKKRPRPVVRTRDVERISRLQPTHREIAAFLGVRLHVWKRMLATDERIKAAYERGTQAGLLSLRRIQLRLAAVNATMAIRLGEVWLGQKSVSRTEVTGADGQPLEFDLSKLDADKRNELRRLLSSATRRRSDS